MGSNSGRLIQRRTLYWLRHGPVIGYLAFASRIVTVIEIVKSHASYSRPWVRSDSSHIHYMLFSSSARVHDPRAKFFSWASYLVCICKKERERERERKKGRLTHRVKYIPSLLVTLFIKWVRRSLLLFLCEDPYIQWNSWGAGSDDRFFLWNSFFLVEPSGDTSSHVHYLCTYSF